MIVALLLLVATVDTVRPVAPLDLPPADSIASPLAGPRRTTLLHPVADTVPTRRRAVEYSDWYARRLTVHRWGSYAMLPLFATEYWLGHKLLNGQDESSSTRDAHAAVASGLGVLFATNTVTGLWNLWDSRQDPAGRKRRWAHSALLLAADAGFLYTASLADDDDEGEERGRRRGGERNTRHRNAALASIGLSTVGTGLMWFFKD